MKNKKVFLFYNNFDLILQNLHKKEINRVDLEILISRDSSFYNGSFFKLFCKDFLNKFLSSGKNLLIEKDKTFVIDSVRFMLADSLKRHNMLYYEVLKDGFDFKKDNIKKLYNCIYENSKKEGLKWFAENLDAINQIMPNSCKLDKDFNLNDEITVLYEGCENYPKIELLRYDYFLNHKDYKKTEKALKEICVFDNSVIERAFQHELNCFIERVKRRNGIIKFENVLREQSYKYLFDETVSFIMKHNWQDNLIEFYFGGREFSPTQVFRGKKAQQDPVIQQYLQGPLKGADQRKFVSVKMVDC